MEKILIMGLPGSGKTYFAEKLKKFLEIHGGIDFNKISSDKPHPDLSVKVDWFNADEVRKEYNDWDFSREGRIRQSFRMLTLMNQSKDLSWVLSFSYGRALQRQALTGWKGEEINVPKAQQAFIEQARLNSLATLGQVV